jgi:Tfp pilus assembly protein PilV
VNRHSVQHGALRRRQRGFTLMTVLIAIFLFGFGLLAILRTMGTVTGGATQNQNLQTTASLSNAFWGVVQANPAIVADSAFANTFTASNITTAPTALQPWLYTVTDSTRQQTGIPPTGLPSAIVKIETFPDTGSTPATACAVASGCSVRLSLCWYQTVVPTTCPTTAAGTRTQIFYYQFGL